MRWTIPNILTLLRLAAAPAVPLMFLYFHRPWADWAALAIFLVAAVTRKAFQILSFIGFGPLTRAPVICFAQLHSE